MIHAAGRVADKAESPSAAVPLRKEEAKADDAKSSVVFKVAAVRSGTAAEGLSALSAKRPAAWVTLPAEGAR